MSQTLPHPASPSYPRHGDVPGPPAAQSRVQSAGHHGGEDCRRAGRWPQRPGPRPRDIQGG